MAWHILRVISMMSGMCQEDNKLIRCNIYSHSQLITYRKYC